MIGPYGIFLDEETGLWQLLPLALADKKGGGGGGGPGLGSKTPRVVTAATGSAGVATRASREDHVHRLEMRIHEDGVAPAPTGRPVVNFIGAKVSDDAGNDRVNVRVPRDLGSAVETDPITVTFASPVTLVSITLTTDDENIQCVFTGSVLCRAAPGSVSGGCNYWIEVDGVPVDGSTGAVSVGALAAEATLAMMSMAAHGETNVAPGEHEIRVRAQAGNATNQPTAGGGGLELALSVRQWSAP